MGCGAAAAIAAAFGAPITGAFYACELIVGVYAVGSAAPILAASLAGALTAQWLGGAPYLLEVPRVGTVGLEQYIALMVLALITAGIGIAVMRSSSLFERLFAQSWLPIWIKPAIGGICVGGLAIITPQVLAAGHGAMILDLQQEMATNFIATVIVLKLIACLISLASGFRGGLFFASLFVGSLIGKLFAALLAMSGLDLAVDPLVAMLTGMATLGVAIVGGPLTMSFLVLEMTQEGIVEGAKRCPEAPEGSGNSTGHLPQCRLDLLEDVPEDGVLVEDEAADLTRAQFHVGPPPDRREIRSAHRARAPYRAQGVRPDPMIPGSHPESCENRARSPQRASACARKRNTSGSHWAVAR